MSTSTPQNPSSTILYTSLAEIKSFEPCASGWKDILKGQNKTQVDDVLFPLIDCVESNSISDVCWLLGKRQVEIDICVKFARMCADSVKHLLSHTSAAAADAAYAASDAASAAAYADAADAAADASYDAVAAYAAVYAAAYNDEAADDAAYNKQKELNKQFLIQAIKDYQNQSDTLTVGE